MKRLYFLPYKMGSGSVKELQHVVGGLKIKPAGDYHLAASHLVVNWGYGDTPYWGHHINPPTDRILNHWTKVRNAINKLTAFNIMRTSGVPIPEFTVSLTAAREMVGKGGVVVCRTILSGMEGAGIVIAQTPDAVVGAPLYTKHFGKEREYRVHVFKGQVIDFVQKKLKSGWKSIPNRSEYIRNTANGWIFARDGVTLPNNAAEAAKQAVAALGLDFGAVDLAVNKKGEIVIFEVNTAPGLEGTTVQRYAEAIKAQLQ